MEVVSSSSPFGCVLKDHNLRRPPMPNTATTTTTTKPQPNLQKALKELVREHLRSSISSISNSNENSNPIQSYNGSRPIHKAEFSREPSPALSDSSSVSCLVQKWSGFEISDPKQIPVPTTSNHQTQSPIPHSGLVLSSRTNSIGSNHDSISDWESDQPPVNDGNKEKIRVADIIKKLPLKVQVRLTEFGEGAVMCSPRIRGRQAVSDLFARLARDRNQEIDAIAKLNAVSKFQKRGRIQSLMKVKLMRPEASTHNQRQHQEPKVQETSKQTRQWLPSVNSLRRLFSTVGARHNDSVNTARNESETSSNNVVVGNASTLNQTSEASNDKCQENDKIPEPNHQEIEWVDQTIETINNEQEEVVLYNQQTEENENWETASSSASTEVVMQDTATQQTEANYYESPRRTDTLSHDVWEEDYEEEMVENEEYYDNDYFESNLDWIHEISRPRSYWESRRQEWYQEIFESSTNNDIRQLIERGSVSTVLASDFRDRMDQLIISNAQLQLHPIESHEDDEGQPMVSRGRVSAVLASDFRDRMNQLMRSKVQLQMHPIECREEEECNRDQTAEEQLVEPVKEEAIGENMDENEDIEEEDIEQSLNYYREQTPLSELPWSNYQDQDQEQPVQEETIREEEMDGIEDAEQNLSYYREQTPVLEQPWSSYQDQEDRSDDLEQIESAIHRQGSFMTNSYDHDSRVGSSIKNHSTMEMELICDIRAHMQQIYREMSEMRKAVNSCMDMQLKFQSSIRDEVSAAMSQFHSEITEGKEPKRKAPKKGSCRNCHKKKADTLLYRCGHMCTCFECAHELQWSSGKCPICWAEIVDVVRVCTDYY